MSNAVATGRGVIIWDPAECVNHLPEATARDLARLSELLNSDPEDRARIVVYQPQTEELADDFESFFAILDRKYHFVLLVDECHWIQNPQWATPSLRKIIRKPNRWDAILMQTCHAPSDTWGRARSLATEWYMFKLTRSADLEAIARECGGEVAKEVEGLPPVENPPLPGSRRVYVHYRVDSARWEIVDRQEDWYVNLSPPPVREEELVYAV